jgi:propanediol utilization protein
MHLGPEETERYQLDDGQSADFVLEGGQRSIVIRDVVVRVAEGMRAMIHIDTDEANACAGLDGIVARIYGNEDQS